MAKAAMELSASFIVWLILGITVFLLGLAFIYQIIKVDIEIPDTIKIALENCVDRGEKVCFPEIRKQIVRKKSYVFHGVINNIVEAEKTFKINMECAGGQDKDGNEIDCSSINLEDWTYLQSHDIEIENNKHYIAQIPIKVPSSAVTGTYVFNVNVCFDDGDGGTSDAKCHGSYNDLYSPTNQIYIKVP